MSHSLRNTATRFARSVRASVLIAASLTLTSASIAAPTTYQYDMHGRLTGITRSGLTVTYAYDSASNRTAANGTLQAVASTAHWEWNKIGTQVFQSPPVVVTASGGTGGYSYLWQWVSGDTVIAVNSPTSSTTTFSRATTPLNVLFTAVWRCRVTDSSTATTYTGNVTVTFLRENAN